MNIKDARAQQPAQAFTRLWIIVNHQATPGQPPIGMYDGPSVRLPGRFTLLPITPDAGSDTAPYGYSPVLWEGQCTLSSGPARPHLLSTIFGKSGLAVTWGEQHVTTAVSANAPINALSPASRRRRNTRCAQNTDLAITPSTIPTQDRTAFRRCDIILAYFGALFLSAFFAPYQQHGPKGRH